jgi:hypothetical protein
MAFLGATPALAGSTSISSLNVPAPDRQVENARVYVAGVLGSDPVALASLRSVLPDFRENDLYNFLWSLRLARPATTWAWNQAVIDEIRPTEDGVAITATIPTVRKLLAGPGSRTMKEWRLYEDILAGKTTITETEKVTRTLQMDASGALRMTATQRSAWVETPLSELRETLGALKKSGERPGFLKRTAPEIGSATTVRLPDDLRDLWLSMCKQ